MSLEADNGLCDVLYFMKEVSRPFADEEGQTITWNPFAFDGFSNNCSRLMTWLAQSLAKLFNTVTIHNNGMPAKLKHTDGLTIK